MPGYSDSWWAALKPYTQAYGEGVIQSSRYEVLWSDILNWSGESEVLAIFRDFMGYLYNEATRLQVLKRFADTVQPLLLAGHTVDVIAHSEGTIVAYEGLRMIPPGLGNVLNFFTLGTALGYAWNPLVPESNVRDHLLAGNASGDRPAVVKNWWNVFASGDPFASPLEPAYRVTEDFGPVDPTGCAGWKPLCCHGSYFNPSNVAVQRDILAARINAAT